ncbi:response regulator transcription factor [Methylophaga sulfidovorans]|uniref:Two component transcriptional regulator, LuxR family n=1 Tax=Methylophaga sulfidovorans TaxID=45496 RepID=A0A1I4BDE8_9GAMM|nr:response regulator transcription factor [Methylophaga sulfidovorans]SFK66079.1 two component transcriptional regulator, LuxR family [Methylophaga sulfidovorans]
MSKTTILLIDDHAILRDGYQHLLNSSGFDVIGQASNSEEGYRLYVSNKPDVCIIDISMPGAGGLECIRRITARDPQAKILVCTMHDDSTLAMRAMDMGARGYITKSCPSSVLIEAVKTISSRGHYLSTEIARSIAMEKLIHADQKVHSLSHQEFAVFRMVAEGKSINEMAENLALAPKTVSNYKTNMMRKLGTNNLAEIIFLAQKTGLITTPPN